MTNKISFNRRKFISTGAAFALGIPILGNTRSKKPHTPGLLSDVKPEWRNKQADMAYRQLGNTGLMISEVVNGGDPVSEDNLYTTEMAMERGLNYLDILLPIGPDNPDPLKGPT